MSESDQVSSSRVTAPVTVAAAGNAFVASDCIGGLVLERLSGRLPEGAEAVNVGTSGLELLDLLRGQELLLIVDACLYGKEPGTVFVMEPDYSGSPVQVSTMHHLGPQEVLTVASILCPERLPAECKLVLVETGGLPAEDLAEVAVRAAAVVQSQVASWFSSSRNRGALSQGLPAGR